MFPKTAWKWKNLDPRGGGGGLDLPKLLHLTALNKIVEQAIQILYIYNSDGSWTWIYTEQRKFTGAIELHPRWQTNCNGTRQTWIDKFEKEIFPDEESKVCSLDVFLLLDPNNHLVYEVEFSIRRPKFYSDHQNEAHTIRNFWGFRKFLTIYEKL